MTQFIRDTPVATREPKVEVDAGLAAGTHRFQLEVVDDSGRRSRADAVEVVVRRRPVGPEGPLRLPLPGGGGVLRSGPGPGRPPRPPRPPRP